MKNKIYKNILLIAILAFFAGNFAYPQCFNRGVDFLNSKFGLGFPYFWDRPFSLGIDLQGGAHLVYRAEFDVESPINKSETMEILRDRIERKINSFGVREPVVQVQGGRLIVELAGVDTAKAKNEIGKTPFLEFKEQKPNYDEIIAHNQEIINSATGTIDQSFLEDPFQSTELTGKYLKVATLDSDGISYKVSLEFNDEGAKIFSDLTSKNVGKILAIFIDGELISAPTVEEAIPGGKAQISGNFSYEEAISLVRGLNDGALPVPITLISQQTVGPTLGKVSLQQSLKAGLLGFLAIIIFMIIFYRFSGLLAAVALAIYIAIILSVFKLVPVTLTLAGIGGLILSIGMAVDANVLIFSRMKEELKGGKDFGIAVDEGFRRAWPAIRDGNFTTLIVALILFGFGTSFIKGFALTLSIGVMISMFSAIVITKNFLKIFVGKKLERIKWLWG